MSDEGRSQRATARKGWPVVRARLEDGSTDLLTSVPVGERIARSGR